MGNAVADLPSLEQAVFYLYHAADAFEAAELYTEDKAAVLAAVEAVQAGIKTAIAAAKVPAVERAPGPGTERQGSIIQQGEDRTADFLRRTR